MISLACVVALGSIFMAKDHVEAVGGKVASVLVKQAAKVALKKVIMDKTKKTVKSYITKEISSDLAKGYVKKNGFNLAKIDNRIYNVKKTTTKVDLACLNQKIDIGIDKRSTGGKSLGILAKIFNFLTGADLIVDIGKYIYGTMTGETEKTLEEIAIESIVGCGLVLPSEKEDITIAQSHTFKPIGASNSKAYTFPTTTVHYDVPEEIGKKEDQNIEPEDYGNSSSFNDGITVVDSFINKTAVWDIDGPKFPDTNAYENKGFYFNNVYIGDSTYGGMVGVGTYINTSYDERSIYVYPTKSGNAIKVYYNSELVSDISDFNGNSSFNVPSEFNDRFSAIMENVKRVKMIFPKSASSSDFYYELTDFNNTIRIFYDYGSSIDKLTPKKDQWTYANFNASTGTYSSSDPFTPYPEDGQFSLTMIDNSKVEDKSQEGTEEPKEVVKTVYEQGDTIYIPVDNTYNDCAGREVKVAQEGEEIVFRTVEDNQVIEDVNVCVDDHTTEDSEPDEPETIDDDDAEDVGEIEPNVDGEEHGKWKIDLDALRIVGFDFTNKFPFSIPWDVKRGMDALFGEITDANKPVWTVTIAGTTFDVKVPDIFDDWMPYIRGFIIIGFDFSCIYAIRKWLSGGG